MIKSHSKGTKLAAAALCIGVGSFSDPRDVPGLAHFLEHMVFMGSKKFPQENDFDSFINNHGGSDNGSTDYEVTTFYFECFEKHFLQALDKFSQFFISPLMKRDSMTREREAVESEFQTALPSDEYRKEQLLVSLADANSPVNSFSWGNMVTLKENISDDELYEKLHEFRKRHYSAHRMTLAVQGRLPMSTLETYVLKCFSDIPSNGVPADDFKHFSNSIFDTPKFKRLYYVKPVADTSQVSLTFCLPSLLQLYKTKPHVYVSWLLGHQGANSLFSYLKKKVWVLSLFAGNEESGAEFNSIYATFTISLVLTKDGFGHLKEIIEAIFAYISLLKEVGPSERIFNEIKCIQEISFRFEEEDTAVDNVEDLSEQMQYFPPVDYLTGDTLIFEYNPDVINMALNNLSPDNMNIMISSTDLPKSIIYNKIEPWFNTHYTDMEIPTEWMDCWKKPQKIPSFSLPKPNLYITTDFTILPKIKSKSKYPNKIMSTPIIELWYRKDEHFELPVAYYYYYLISPSAIKDSLSSCLIQIYVVLVTMNLGEEGYEATLAELEYEVVACEAGVCIKVSGYNEKLPLLIQLVGKYLTNVAELLTEPTFNAVKEKLTKSLFNGFYKPSRLCKDLRLSILGANYFSLIERHSSMSEVTYTMMKNFLKNFLKNLYIQGLVQGNVTSETVLKVTNKLLEHLKTASLSEEDRPKIIMNQIPVGEHCLRVNSFNKENPNSIITNYYQCGVADIKNTVILELILLLIEEPLFDTLRTKEQLGYKVGCLLRDTNGVLGYTINVTAQARKYTTQYVDSRIEEFVEFTHKLLKKLTDKRFAQTKHDLIKLKQYVDIDLEDETLRNWDEIVNCKYQFNRTEQEIKMIQSLQFGEVRKWWEANNLSSKNGTCRKLSIQVVGYPLSDAENPKDIVEKVDKVMNSSSPRIQPEVLKLSYDVDHLDLKDEAETENNPTMGQQKVAIDYVKDDKEIKTRNKSYFITDINEFKQNLVQFKYPLL
ncbi:hypothetical protein FQA39_LY06631 [Lamprigera yunnana]|nr:hypothetical protein FQA39_LY06631 [Lamprigera yunnana]